MNHKIFNLSILKVLFIFFLFFLVGTECSIAESGSIYLTQPNGKYNVGFKDYHLINKKACPNKFYSISNSSSFSRNNSKHCDEIWLRVYYPTELSGISNYYPSQSLIRDIKSISKTITQSDINQIKEIKSYSKNDAPISKGKFPVIFFSPGYGISAQSYENIITNLASHGYIVIGINSQFINGELILENGSIIDVFNPHTATQKKDLFLNSISDLAYVFQYLKSGNISDNVMRSINWNNVGLIGHSLGSGTVVHLPTLNNIKAIASLDFSIDLIDKTPCRKMVDTPFMQIFSTAIFLQNKTGNFPYYCHNHLLPKNDYVVILKNNLKSDDANYSMHLNFTDYSTLQYQPIILKGLNDLFKNPKLRFLGTVNGVDITNTINEKLLNFFNLYLRNISNNKY